MTMSSSLFSLYKDYDTGKISSDKFIEKVETVSKDVLLRKRSLFCANKVYANASLSLTVGRRIESQPRLHELYAHD